LDGSYTWVTLLFNTIKQPLKSGHSILKSSCSVMVLYKFISYLLGWCILTSDIPWCYQCSLSFVNITRWIKCKRRRFQKGIKQNLCPSICTMITCVKDMNEDENLHLRSSLWWLVLYIICWHEIKNKILWMDVYIHWKMK
jgi:hypothetical protein